MINNLTYCFNTANQISRSLRMPLIISREVISSSNQSWLILYLKKHFEPIRIPIAHPLLFKSQSIHAF